MSAVASVVVMMSVAVAACLLGAGLLLADLTAAGWVTLVVGLFAVLVTLGQTIKVSRT